MRFQAKNARRMRSAFILSQYRQAPLIWTLEEAIVAARIKWVEF